MKNILLILLSLIIISCGPNYYLRRANINLKKAEQLGAKVNNDTIYQEVKVFIPEIHKDTIFHSVKGDTVYIHKERLTIKYVKLKGDSVYLKGDCKDSIIYVKHPVLVNRTIESVKEKLPWWVYIVFGVSIFVIIILSIRR